MGTVALVALGTDGRHRALRGLGAAVVVLLLVDPGLAVSAGFALSVLATAGILLLAPAWRDALARWLPRWLAEAIAVPAAAQLACTPLVAAISGQVSLVAVAANLLVAPVVGPATVLGLLGGVLGLVWAPVGRLGRHAGGLVRRLDRRGGRARRRRCRPRRSAGGPARRRWRSWSCRPSLVARRPGRGCCGSRSPARRPACVLRGRPVLVRPPTSGLAARRLGARRLRRRSGRRAGARRRAGRRPSSSTPAPTRARSTAACDRLGVDAGAAAGADPLPRRPRRRARGRARRPRGRARSRRPGCSTRPAGCAGSTTDAPAPGLTAVAGDVRRHPHGRRRRPSRCSGRRRTRRPSGRATGAPPTRPAWCCSSRSPGVRLLLTGDVEPEGQAALARLLPGLHVDVLKMPHHGSRYQDERLAALPRRPGRAGVGGRRQRLRPPGRRDARRPRRRRAPRCCAPTSDGDLVVVVRDGRLVVRTRDRACRAVGALWQAEPR